MAETVASPRSSYRIWLLKVGLPLAILGLAVAGFTLLKATRAVTPPVVAQEKSWRVSAIEVTPGRLTPNLLLYGVVEAPKQAEIRAAVTADVAHVEVREGQIVADDAPLVILDERDLALSLRQREADLREIEAQIASEQARYAANQDALKREEALLELAKRAVTRAQNLNTRKMISESALDEAFQTVEKQALALNARQLEVDDHTARLAQLQARHARAEALRDQARLDLARAKITAPFAGRVVQAPVAPGDRVRPGDLLLEMYPLGDLEVRAQIPFRALPTVRAALAGNHSLPATAIVDGQPVTAQLDRLGGEAGQNNGGLDALFRIAQGAQWLTPGRVLTLHMDLPPEEDVVALPFEALYGLDRIYRLENGRMAAVNVERVGEQRNAAGQAQVLAHSPDLKAGDRIITTQLPNAITGLKVEVKE
ncbi:MAG: HlyD family efflux transporter periplasmic adaptor subunit [Candidatus Competibacteraceae bacterium]|nr:HlyD family efflux transporter periplasmic adaptor subunit [Candidatus Competibacteraceae bacterium]